jgi:hypothetical protein
VFDESSRCHLSCIKVLNIYKIIKNTRMTRMTLYA